MATPLVVLFLLLFLISMAVWDASKSAEQPEPKETAPETPALEPEQDGAPAAQMFSGRHEPKLEVTKVDRATVGPKKQSNLLTWIAFGAVLIMAQLIPQESRLPVIVFIIYFWLRYLLIKQEQLINSLSAKVYELESELSRFVKA